MTLPPKLELEYQVAFDMIDKDGDKNITATEWDGLITKIGAFNAKKLAAEMWKNSGAGSQMSYDAFKTAFAKHSVIVNTKSEIMSAFEVFDHEKTGNILDVEVRQIFSQIGNFMDKEEIEELVGHLKPDTSGKCNYRALVDRMFTICQERPG